MQIKKSKIGKVFEKLKLDVRSTKHRYGWFIFEGRKILRVHYSHGRGNIPGRVSDKIGSELYDHADRLDFVQLYRKMQIVDGPNEVIKPRNVGLLFFNEQPNRFFS